MRVKPVVITKGSFAFCRATIASLLWLSVCLQLIWPVAVVFVLMLLSAAFKVSKAPLILLYRHTVERLKPSENIIVDERGIYVSHVTGAVFALLCLLLLVFTTGPAAWIVTALFAVLQTSAAFGFCSALKLYTCLAGGSCCRAGKFIQKRRGHV